MFLMSVAVGKYRLLEDDGGSSPRNSSWDTKLFKWRWTSKTLLTPICCRYCIFSTMTGSIGSLQFAAYKRIISIFGLYLGRFCGKEFIVACRTTVNAVEPEYAFLRLVSCQSGYWKLYLFAFFYLNNFSNLSVNVICCFEDSTIQLHTKRDPAFGGLMKLSHWWSLNTKNYKEQRKYNFQPALTSPPISWNWWLSFLGSFKM